MEYKVPKRTIIVLFYQVSIRMIIVLFYQVPNDEYSTPFGQINILGSYDH